MAAHPLLRKQRRTRRDRKSQDRGQAALLFVVVAAVLVSVAGLTVDTGFAGVRSRRDQSVADGAALAAAYHLYVGNTRAEATGWANRVAEDNGCVAPRCAIALEWLDARRRVAATDRQIASVRAHVTDTRDTYFVRLSGGPRNFTVKAAAEALVSGTQTVRKVPPAGAWPGSPAVLPSKPPAPPTSGLIAECAVCSLGPPNAGILRMGLNLGGGGGITVARGDVSVNGDVMLNTSTAVSLAAGRAFTVAGTVLFGPCSGCTPAPVAGPPISDPLAYLATPSAYGLRVFGDVWVGDKQTLEPGVYGRVTFGAGITVNMNPGVYIFAGGGFSGPALGAGDTVRGRDVTLYFTCGTPSAVQACGGRRGAGQAGATFSEGAGDTLDLHAPTTGPFANVLMYFDRLNTSWLQYSGGDAAAPNTISGSLYGASAQLFLGAGGASINFDNSLVFHDFHLGGGGASITIGAAAGSSPAPSSGAATGGVAGSSGGSATAGSTRAVPRPRRAPLTLVD